MLQFTENPLNNKVPDGGMCAIFRTIGVVGDSLSSGEFESKEPDGTLGWHDMYEYSWGQFIARKCGSRCFNFSRGGMTAKEFNASFGKACGFEEPENVCQAYILALGVNDILNAHQPVGSLADVDWENPDNNQPTFAGEYAKILQKIRKMQPRSRLFLMTMPRTSLSEHPLHASHAELLHAFAEKLPFTYVLDLYRYAPLYDEEFRRQYYMGGHLNPMGYVLTANFVMSYIDSIIRAVPEDFAQVGYIGTDLNYHGMRG